MLEVPKDKDGDNLEVDLFKPAQHTGHCLTPPLMPSLAACPTSGKLQDGKAAVAYPKKEFNCNPFGIDNAKGLT